MPDLTDGEMAAVDGNLSQMEWIEPVLHLLLKLQHPGGQRRLLMM